VILSQKFVQIMLNSQDGVVSLEQAGHIIEKQSRADEHSRPERRLYDVASVLCSLNLVPPFSILFHSFHAIQCMFQIQKNGFKTFKWIYNPAITDEKICNVGSDAPPMTAIKTKPDASHALMNPVTKGPNSEEKPKEFRAAAVKRTREPETGNDFQQQQRGNQYSL
jgi:hypothetical protein